jgi:hypothetical protein
MMRSKRLKQTERFKHSQNNCYGVGTTCSHKMTNSLDESGVGVCVHASNEPHSWPHISFTSCGKKK